MREIMPEFTNSAFDWLLLILEERFGHRFLLEQSPLGLKLSLANMSQGYILFPKLEKAFHLSSSNFPCSQWDADKAGWVSVLEKPLPAPCVSELPEPLIEEKNGCFVINYDILGLTYWMLNRIEEIGRNDLDNHDRFPATSSHAYKHGYLERPIVDEWLHILGQVIQRLWPQLRFKQHTFSMKVSHDVDAPSLYAFSTTKSFLKNIAGDVLKRKDIKSVLTAPLVRFNSRTKLHSLDSFNTFDWIMTQSEQNNLTSAFYFICGRTDNTKDADYEPEYPAIRNLMKEIHKRGHEIGLHPSYNSFQSPSVIKDEANRLRKIMQEENIQQDIIGGRMHYLRWEHPTTLQAWNDAGMSYDSTLGYADRPGFRCGTCFEYQAFNPMTQQILDLKIRPLIAMESSIIAERYMGLGYSKSAENKFIDLKEKCSLLKGTFTLLWHNSFFQNKESFELYSRIISPTCKGKLD